jgi:hypothetical protein
MTAATAVKAPGGEALLGRAVAPEGKHGRHSPSRAAGRDPVETPRFHNNSYANRVPDLHRMDGISWPVETVGPPYFVAGPGPNEKHAPEPDSRSRKFDTDAIAAIRL